jgi:hypothetical protein
MFDTIRYLHRSLQTLHSLWPDMSNYGRIWKTILFWWLWATPIFVDHESSCVGKYISLYFHAYEECPNQRSYMSYASIWRQGGFWPWDWLKVRLCKSDLDYISTLTCTSSRLSSTLLMSHISSMIHSFISWSHESEWRTGCARIETWKKRHNNVIYRWRRGIGWE